MVCPTFAIPVVMEYENDILTRTDCVSFKPNSTDILVQNLHCNGSHGISVGSLGQYKGEVDIVKNVLVYNISMYNASVRHFTLVPRDLLPVT